MLDAATRRFVRVDGFATAERERDGKKRIAGPSSVAMGAGYAYVGDRATSEVCPVETATLHLAACVKLPASPDGVAYVAATREVWVTTPSTQSVVVLDAAKPGALAPVATVHLDGSPEGYASDARRGVFYTNLEDKNALVEIELASRKPRATFPLECGAQGPRGVAADADRGLVVVACTDHLVVLDPAHGGATISKVDTGAGVDNIDWVPILAPRLPARRRGQGRAAHRRARRRHAGHAAVVASLESVTGARNVVAGPDGKKDVRGRSPGREAARLSRSCSPVTRRQGFQRAGSIQEAVGGVGEAVDPSGGF